MNNNFSPSTDIRLFILNDEFTLEYNDRVQLRFNPTEASVMSALASYFEYIRDNAIINIIDKDR